MFFSCLVVSGGVVRIFPKALEHAHGHAPARAIPRADEDAPKLCLNQGTVAPKANCCVCWATGKPRPLQGGLVWPIDLHDLLPEW